MDSTRKNALIPNNAAGIMTGKAMKMVRPTDTPNARAMISNSARMIDWRRSIFGNLPVNRAYKAGTHNKPNAPTSSAATLKRIKY